MSNGSWPHTAQLNSFSVRAQPLKHTPHKLYSLQTNLTVQHFWWSSLFIFEVVKIAVIIIFFTYIWVCDFSHPFAISTVAAIYRHLKVAQYSGILFYKKKYTNGQKFGIPYSFFIFFPYFRIIVNPSKPWNSTTEKLPR